MSRPRTLIRKSKPKTMHNLRIVAGGALIGSVLTGVFFGWVPSPFDLRVVGAGLGAIASAATLLRIV